jgi:hypothetical protein
MRTSLNRNDKYVDVMITSLDVNSARGTPDCFIPLIIRSDYVVSRQRLHIWAATKSMQLMN